MKNGLFATINIGASAFRMHISEFHKGVDRTLETLVVPLRFGGDTFTKGYITLEKVYQATDILKKFKNKMSEYGIKKNYIAVCTSGVREASNMSFFLDHIKRNVGLNLDVIVPSDEIYIKYVGIKNDIENYDDLEKEGVLFANVSSGNVTISIIKNEIILFSAAMPYGSLRLREMFQSIPLRDRYKAYKQYIQKMFINISSSLPKDIKVKHFVSSGSSINTLIDIIKPEEDYITKKDIEAIFEEIKIKPVEEIKRMLDIRSNEAETILPTLETYLTMLNYTSSDRCIFSRQTFPHTLTLFHTRSIRDKDLRNRVRKTLFYTGDRLNFDKVHAKTTTEFAGQLFSDLKPIHSLESSYKILIEAGAILHDVGYFIAGRKHHEHSFYITGALNIPGVNSDNREVVAYLTLFHKKDITEGMEQQFLSLSTEKQLIVKKLVSILRIADSLDSSHMQLINSVEVQILKNKVLIKAKCKKKPYLEIMNFEEKKKIFEETFGIPIELETRILYE